MLEINKNNIMMDSHAVDTLLKHIKQNGKMFEWGSGGSTLELSKVTGHYFSVEHSAEWCEKMMPLLGSQENRITYIYRPPNDPNLKAHEDGNYEQMRDYVDSIDVASNYGKVKFDNILVDGRARVECAFKAYSHLHEDGVIFVDDYFERPEYHTIERWYELIDASPSRIYIGHPSRRHFFETLASSDRSQVVSHAIVRGVQTLAVFKKRKNTNMIKKENIDV